MSDRITFLDMDEIVPAKEIAIKIEGVEHEMADMSVDDFIWVQKRIDKAQAALAKGEEPNEAEYALSIVDMLSRRFPTVPEGAFRKMGFDKLRRLTAFIEEVIMDGAPEPVEGDEEGEVKAKG